MSDAHPGRGDDGSPDGGDSAAQPRARLADLGVAAYDGPRGGVAVAVAALATHTARRLLGLGRRPRAKLVPLAVLALAYIPAVAFLGVAVLVPEELSALLTLDVRTLLSTITVAVAVFVALTGPVAPVRT
jgi:ABC-2 type transport system permease protein